jgi:hypothetical protein
LPSVGHARVTRADATGAGVPRLRRSRERNPDDPQVIRLRLRVQDGIGAGARRCDRRGGAGRSAAGDQHGATANRPRREQRAIESQRLAVVIPNAALRADGGHSHDARTFRISVEWLAAQLSPLFLAPIAWDGSARRSACCASALFHRHRPPNPARLGEHAQEQGRRFATDRKFA